MKLPVSIRRATASDAQNVAEFNVAMALESEGRSLDLNVIFSGVRAVIEDDRHGFYLLAEFNDEVVGQLLVTYEWSDWRNGQFWWIQSVYVKPEMRGRGVYRSLHGFIEEAARKSGACGLRLYVEKENFSAQKTYAKLGMTETSYRMYEIEFKS